MIKVVVVVMVVVIGLNWSVGVRGIEKKDYICIFFKYYQIIMKFFCMLNLKDEKKMRC